MCFIQQGPYFVHSITKTGHYCRKMSKYLRELWFGQTTAQLHEFLAHTSMLDGYDQTFKGVEFIITLKAPLKQN